MEKSQERQTAYKIRISDIHNSNYIKEDGWNPNYLETWANIKIARVNLMGVIVSKINQENNNISYIVLDDGTEKISIRSFEAGDVFSNQEVGDIVNIIGRPREYNGEKYVIMEIIRKLYNNRWVELRKIEYELISKKLKRNKDLKNTIEKQSAPISNTESIKEESSIKNDEDNKNISDGPDSEGIYKIIKEQDSGDGIDIQKIISISKSENTEKIIKALLEEGEIFEIKPGRVKALE